MPLKGESGGELWLDTSILFMITYVIFRGGFINWVLMFPYPHPIIRLSEKMVLLLIFGFILFLLGVFDGKILDLGKKLSYRFIYRMWYLNFTNRQFIIFLGGTVGKSLYETFDRG